MEGVQEVGESTVTYPGGQAVPTLNGADSEHLSGGREERLLGIVALSL